MTNWYKLKESHGLPQSASPKDIPNLLLRHNTTWGAALLDANKAMFQACATMPESHPDWKMLKAIFDQLRELTGKLRTDNLNDAIEASES